ncbi:MAG: hypothetical protein IJ091_08335 [Oscillospiraceae bacterium]|nr:hypothetical protein [Oscillospiraceae bacterium]
MSDKLDQLKEILLSGNTAALEREADRALDTYPGDLQVLAYLEYAKLGETLRNYKVHAAKLWEEVSKKGTKSFFSRVILGKDEFYTSTLHSDYFQNMETAVNQLETAFQRLDKEDPVVQDLSYEAVRLLIEGAAEDEEHMRFLLSADDTYAMKLLPYVRKESLRELRDNYLKTYPKKSKRLPNQENLLKEMKNLIGD